MKNKMDNEHSINHNLEGSAVAALALLRSGALDTMKAKNTEEEHTSNPSTPQCGGAFSQTTTEHIIDAALLGFNCHTVTPDSSPNNKFTKKPQMATNNITKVRREEVTTCCELRRELLFVYLSSRLQLVEPHIVHL